jgi:hypothetical protein
MKSCCAVLFSSRLRCDARPRVDETLSPSGLSGPCCIVQQRGKRSCSVLCKTWFQGTGERFVFSMTEDALLSEATGVLLVDFRFTLVPGMAIMHVYIHSTCTRAAAQPCYHVARHHSMNGVLCYGRLYDEGPD